MRADPMPRVRRNMGRANLGLQRSQPTRGALCLPRYSALLTSLMRGSVASIRLRYDAK